MRKSTAFILVIWGCLTVAMYGAWFGLESSKNELSQQLREPPTYLGNGQVVFTFKALPELLEQNQLRINDRIKSWRQENHYVGPCLIEMQRTNSDFEPCTKKFFLFQKKLPDEGMPMEVYSL